MPDIPKYYRSTFTWEGKRYERKSQKSQRDADRKADALEVYKRPAIGDSQYARYKGIIDNIIIPAIGARPIKSIKDIELQKILNSHLGKSKSDIRKLRDTIKGIFRRSYASGLISKDPSEFIEMPDAIEGTRRSITPYERQKILEVAETHPAGLWVKLMLYCGLRPGEARALDWRHVDFDKKIIHIECAMKSRTKVIGNPISSAGIRDVPVPDMLLPLLLENRKGPFEPVVVKPLSQKRHDEHSMMYIIPPTPPTFGRGWRVCGHPHKV